ncbi:MAG TPA: squalene/phytoene synthase family protein [Terrimicrobiaceae bacterium]|nr:squalene/phytoene synthase family protein [Terrimicrobiaceae bacterium]
MDWPLLRRVSRSFYLTLRLLPPQVRESIALAYLVARLSDTLADGAQTEGEKQLLARRKEIEGWLEKSPDRHDIETVWSTIQQGQRFDQDRFSTNPAPLSAEELDNYTYLVAGCVGEFWTRLCQKKIPGFASRDLGEMIDLGIRFGKGLQLVNILRDRHADAENNRIYVPPTRFDEVLAAARAHLEAAQRYVAALRNYRLRVACALPLDLATETLDLVEKYPVHPRVKVSRLRVWILLVRATIPGANRVGRPH